MELQIITENKKQYLDLLLFADEQESMIDSYPERGNMYALYDDSPLTLLFYEHCGFQRTHVIPKFFIDNYNHKIFEAVKQLCDMIYLQKEL